MTGKSFHKDWPLYSETSWDSAIYDLKVSLETLAYNADPLNPGPGETITLDDIDSIELYHLSYNGEKTLPDDAGGTELELIIVGTLNDGRWLFVEAWNDYTGWGCRDGSVVRTAATLPEIVAGLTPDSRRELGL